MTARKKLPKGWRWAKLDEVLEIDNQEIRPVAGTIYRYIGLENIESGLGDFLEIPEVDGREIGSGKYMFGDKHVLYGKLRPYLNKVALPIFEGICSTDILPLLPKPGIARDYLAFWLRTPEFVAYATQDMPGTKMPRLAPDKILRGPIPIPATETDQERIVAVLRQADAIRRKRDEARRLADQILPALFLDIFGDPIANPKNWPKRRIGSLCRVVRGAHPRPAGDPRYFGGDIPIAYISDVTSEVTRTLKKTKHTVTEAGQRKARFLKEGTLVVTGNTTTGIPKILGMDCCVHDGFRAFTELSNAIERDYLYWYFRNTVAFYERLTPGEGLRGGLKVSDYEDFEIPFPPKPYQTQLAETMNRAEDILEGQLEAIPMQDRVFSGLLARAFAGELFAAESGGFEQTDHVLSAGSDIKSRDFKKS